jgi:hypothetical protein
VGARPVSGILVLVLALAGCSSSRIASIGRIVSSDGRATLVHNGVISSINGELSLFSGDTIEVREGGVGNLTLSGGRKFELAKARIKARATGATIIGGEVLVLVPGKTPVSVGPAQIRATTGPLRIDVGDRSRVAAYGAQGVVVRSGSQLVKLPPYWQTELLPEGAIGESKPLILDADDRWDQRFAGEAIQTDYVLGNLLRGLQAQLAGAERGPVVAEITSAGITPDRLLPFAAYPQSDLLVGLSMAREWKTSSPEDIGARFQGVLILHTVGTSWGLIAQQLGVDREAFVSTLNAVVTRITTPAITGPHPVTPAPITPSPRPVTIPAQTPPQTQPVAPPPPAPEKPKLPLPDVLRNLLPGDLQLVIDDLYGLLHALLPGLAP